MQKLKTEQPPTLLSEEMNRANTMIRDQLSGSFSAIHVDDKATCEEIKNYIKLIAPERAV